MNSAHAAQLNVSVIYAEGLSAAVNKRFKPRHHVVDVRANAFVVPANLDLSGGHVALWHAVERFIGQHKSRMAGFSFYSHFAGI
jgi:hypothetical protein